MPQDRLLSPARRSGEDNEDQDSVEEALLSGEHVSRKGSSRAKGFFGRWKNPLITTWAALATIILLVLGVLYIRSHPEDTRPAPSPSSSPSPPKKPTPPTPPTPPENPKNPKKRNLIFMVSDGMGPASLSLTRSWRQFTEGLPINDILTLDQNFIGSSRTRSSNSLVTDSAAGATAFSCGMKSYNGAISVLPDGNPCGTVLEAAKAAGYKTGLVVTTSVTDATPACFNSHVNMRWEQDRIAEQQIGDHPLGLVTDLILGGGLCHFLGNSTPGSCRNDDRDLLGEGKKKHGIEFLTNIGGFKYLRMGKFVKMPLFGLFASTDIPYKIDRDPTMYPSLTAMAETAITALDIATRNSEKGFFLMIEGSRIDHAGHGNDPAAQVREVREYDETFKMVMQKIDELDTETVVISTSDHETGGLSVSRQLTPTYPDYLWYPSVLDNATHSSEYMAKTLADFDEPGEMKIIEFINKLLLLQGIKDAGGDEVTKLVKYKMAGLSTAYIWADMISRRAQIGWSTHGHSAVDVNIYAYPRKLVEKLHGNHENTEIGEFLRNYLDVDVEAITKKLRENGTNAAWMGRTLEDILESNHKSMGVGGDVGEVTVDGMDAYHGVHKRACMH
ncbi:hypothetical protein TWF694_010486 [Orbilia ellipsospora]|uniref:Alkaline phosphatase n=1 Tax=Orbilia ellipsospora TaxID=2528407 RepID=A0AAV9XB69_9PEZI